MFLKGFREFKRKGRSDRSDWRKPPEYDVTNSFGLLTDEASCESTKEEVEEPDQQNISKQEIFLEIDSDITKFLKKKIAYWDELKSQLTPLSASEITLQPGLIKLKKADGSISVNCKKSCEEKVMEFTNSLKKQSFPLDESIGESILEALPTFLRQSLSFTKAACWLDKHKQNLILVSTEVELNNAVKEVEGFIQKVGIFARKKIQIEESIGSLVKRELLTLKESLKSYTITINEDTLTLVGLRNNIDYAVEKVENFFQELQRKNQANGNVCCCVASYYLVTRHFMFFITCPHSRSIAVYSVVLYPMLHFVLYGTLYWVLSRTVTACCTVL